MAVRAGALDALEPNTDATPRLPELSVDDLLPYLEALLEEHGYVELRSVVSAIYGVSSIDSDLFDPMYHAIGLLSDQGRAQRVGHGVYVTPERYAEHPRHTSRKKILRKLNYRPATLAAIYWELHEQAPAPRADEPYVDLVITLRNLVDEGVLAIDEQPVEHHRKTIKLYRLVTMDDTFTPDTEPEAASPPPAVVSESGYPITFSGGPPQIELHEAAPLHIKDLGGAKPSEASLPGHSVNNKTGRKGGAANTHSPKRRR
jgi:hypothetical protein